jgi:hypothetical protein
MSLLKYWPSIEEINACIKHEAEGAHDAVLLAAHRPFPLSYKQISSGEKFNASEEALFEYLISQDVPSGSHVIPITGASGVGKSHMVRILNARLQGLNADDKYVVIRIPKSASLRKVVELILEKLPEEEYAQVRAEFAKALTEDLDVNTAVIRLQGQITIALGQLAKELEARVRANPRDTALKAQLGHATNLPKFMGDPELVDHFYETVFPRFVQRAIAGKHLSEQDEFIRDFVTEDFVLPESLDLSRAARSTNYYYVGTLLSRDGEGTREAVRLLNDNMIVDQAIRQLFNLHQSLGGMTLQEVIHEIRRRLLLQGRELVIFVEDFKALTGIQDILLKVLIQEGVRDGVQELATMRSVIAVTDGYLDEKDTIATRAKREWKVESELSSPDEVLSRTKALVAAYLNAARWGFKELVSHFVTKEETGYEHSAWIHPYADHDDDDAEILAAFGHKDGIPLFPFTEQAIEQLARAALTLNDKLIFTPRFIIDNILRTILLEGRPAFERGQFPPPSINAPATNAVVTQWLGALPVSQEMRERYRRIVAIWGNAPRTVVEVGYIPHEVFDAFKLEPPNIEFQRPPELPPSVPYLKPDPSPPPTKTDDASLIESLEKWVQGERLTQRVADQIRKSVAAALNDRIDWNAERCTQIKKIESRTISIPNAMGEANIDKNPIKVAADHTDPNGQIRSELAAVTRLYELNSRIISYTDSDEDMVWVGNLTDRLMPQALTIIRAEMHQRLGAALRLLQVNSEMLGLTTRGKTPSSLAHFLFDDVEKSMNVPVSYNQTFVDWFAVKDLALRVRPELIHKVVSFCGSFQGGSVKTSYAIDMVRIANVLKSEVGSLSPREQGFTTEVASLLENQLRESVTKTKAKNALKEATSIRTTIIAEFGESFDKQEISYEFEALADQLGECGAWLEQDIGMGKVAFKNRCREFRATALQEAIATISNANDEDANMEHAHLLSRMGRLNVTPLIVAVNFVNTARLVVRVASRYADNLESKFEGINPEAEAEEIQAILGNISRELDYFAAEGDGS